MKPNETIYAGEAQLAGWGDTHTGGAKVTFWLPSAEDLDKFRALTVRKGNTAGHRVMLAVVEIGEEEEPVPPPEGTKASEPPKKTRTGPLCMEAIDYCRNEQFRWWVSEVEQIDPTEANAKQFILDTCGVTSRKELDTAPEAGLSFVNLIRIPFAHWQRGHE